MEIYLDNSSTTRVYDSVNEIVRKVMIEDYGNPSSIHLKGYEAEKYIKNSKLVLSKILKVSEKEIYFTSGGTESNNLAIIGSAMANKRAGMHIITSKIEHPSVINSMKYLEEQGFEVTYISTDKDGVVDLEQLKKSIRKDTILVSIMYVNNEIGSVQPIEEIGSLIKKINPDTNFHVDAVQAFGKYIINPKKLNADMISGSGHKIHGPKGVGFLYIKSKTKIKPILFGGGQQDDLRPGTENVPGIAGLAEAAKLIYENRQNTIEKLYVQKDFFIDELIKIDVVKVNTSKGQISAPNIISVSFKDIKSEVLLHALEDENIYVSSGSACNSSKRETSKTLKAIGLEKDYIDGTIRFSFSEFTTNQELEQCIKILKHLPSKLRLYKHY